MKYLGQDQSPFLPAKSVANRRKKRTPTPPTPCDNYPDTGGYYLQGHATGVRETMAMAFHPEAHLTYVLDDGTVRTITLEDFLSGFSGRPAPDEAQRVRTIEMVDIAETAAVGKIILDYPTIRFVDYMSLLKVNGEWKIIHKSYHREPKG
ncbi:MAG: nuclear transport factor 2 family protein [Longimicrobiales bacterium]